jgi:hypothetical protein
MAKKDNESFIVSADDMRAWLKREIEDLSKATELRVAEATGLVESYARCELSQDELEKRIHEYSCRWGEPLPGVWRSHTMTDKQILAKINRTRVSQGDLDPNVLRSRNTGPRTRHR